jgi:sugar phosphate isomerase/epimerase
MPAFDLVFWPACVRLKPFKDHVKAAAIGGFDSISMSWDVIQDEMANGQTVRDIRMFADDAGIALRHFDCLTDWAPVRLPPDNDPGACKRMDISVEQALDLFGELGTETVTVVGAYEPDSVPLDQLISGFGAFCDRAAQQMLWVDVEYMPFYGVQSLDAAWEIVGGAARPNSGILIDVWHFAKCGGCIAALEAIPGHHLRSIQLSDGFYQQRGANMFEDTVSHRAFPLEGEMPVREVLQALLAKGNLYHIGTEVFSEEANAMTAEDAGRRSWETTWPLLLEYPETRAAGEKLRDKVLRAS